MGTQLRFKTEYLAHKNACLGLSWRTRLFAGLPTWLHRYPRSLATRRSIPPVVGAGVPAASRTRSESCGQRGKVLLFIHTFTHYYTPEVGAAAMRVLEAGGYSVEVLRPVADDAEPARPLCCGRTYLSQGMVDAARLEA